MYSIAKRFFDILFAGFGLLIFLPVFILIILFVKVLMPGPVFFKQHRIGKHGKSFLLFKFRSMKVLNEAKQGKFDVGDTSRVTPIGKILRKTKLDELPQLLNVLYGDMSVVGPRPEIELWTKVYEDKWKIVHSVNPGITDNASIEFRNEEEVLSEAENPQAMYRDVVLPRKLDLYIQYVSDQSLLGDLKIIMRTIKTIIFR
jgi:lipopolysaccharide/colanic/teichoic acid biosynthesis glycosyltransferase